MKKQTVFLMMLAAVCMAGCALIKDDKAPDRTIDPKIVKMEKTLWPNAKDWPEKKWWRKYNSAQLNALIETALKESPSMKIAAKRVALAEAQADLLKKGHGPSIGFNGFINWQMTSEEGFLGPYAMDEPALGMDGPWYTTGNIGLVGNYELDIFGKNKAEVSGAIGLRNARLAEKAEAELQLATAIAQTYWDMQVFYELKNLLEETRGIETDVLIAQEAISTAGLSSLSDVRSTEGRIARLEEQIIGVEGNIAVLRESLRALVGLEKKLPEIYQMPLPSIKGRMPETLNYDLIARRPDLQAARWYMEASLGRVESAKAAFYPKINIMAFLGLDAIHLDDLFKSAATQFNLIGGISLPVFDSGRLNAKLKVARTESDLNIAMYNKAVVDAVQNVAKSAEKLKTLERQSEKHGKSLSALEFGYESAVAHEKRGLSDKTAVRKAKLPVLAERERILKVRGQGVAAEIDLIRALGGGYNTKPEDK